MDLYKQYIHWGTQQLWKQTGDCILITAPQPKQTRGSSKAGCAGLQVNMPLDHFSAAVSEI